jgi:hypothetical protein
LVERVIQTSDDSASGHHALDVAIEARSASALRA